MISISRLTLIIAIVIITIVAMEYFSGGYVIKVKNDNITTLTFADGSKLMVYTTTKRKSPDALRIDFVKRLMEIDKTILPDMRKKPVMKSLGYGAYMQMDDTIEWSKAAIEDAQTSPLSAAKSIVGVYVFYNYWYVMTLFRYASPESSAVASVVKRTNKRSMADDCSIIDFMKVVKVRSKSSPIAID